VPRHPEERADVARGMTDGMIAGGILGAALAWLAFAAGRLFRRRRPR
jgi:hypothetical protein